MVVRSLVAAALVVASSSVAVAAPPGHVSGYVLVALNPQPEPPGVTYVGSVTDSVRVGPALAGHVALNPQPEPPGVIDARRLPPGPCRTLVVTVAVPGAAPVRTEALMTGLRGKCSYDVAVPGVRAGAAAKVTITRAR